MFTWNENFLPSTVHSRGSVKEDDVSEDVVPAWPIMSIPVWSLEWRMHAAEDVSRWSKKKKKMFQGGDRSMDRPAENMHFDVPVS